MDRMSAVPSALGLAIAGSLAIAPLLAGAHPPSPQECREGGEFIGNAAASRDQGVPRAVFVGRLEADLQAIRSFPPALRWFAQDEEDERLLRAAVAEVFDAPEPPPLHRARFEALCLLLGERAAKGG